MPFFFFFNDTATTEIYTLSLHDALPILLQRRPDAAGWRSDCRDRLATVEGAQGRGLLDRRSLGVSHTDRKSTRLNSSHSQISYAVFCLKKKKDQYHQCIYFALHVPN